MSEQANEPRAAIADALRAYLTPEQLKTLLDEVLASTKRAHGWCGTCKRSVEVQVPDAKAVTSAIVELATQGFGRPAVAADAGPEREPINFSRQLFYNGVETKEV